MISPQSNTQHQHHHHRGTIVSQLRPNLSIALFIPIHKGHITKGGRSTHLVGSYSAVLWNIISRILSSSVPFMVDRSTLDCIAAASWPLRESATLAAGPCPDALSVSSRCERFGSQFFLGAFLSGTRAIVSEVFFGISTESSPYSVFGFS